ncbi:hypothetical protein [Desulforegula conservatrix]|uniref:hypothetical protein n=1 Tax=Desulforegula conservatrix TaxID=153026 RepID=UPI000410FB89|nr:hypothetical protein [Desulforegula conservatrix]
MLKVYIDNNLDLSNPDWLRNQVPSTDKILGGVAVNKYGIENGRGWIEVAESDIDRLDGLAFRMYEEPVALPEIVFTNITCDKPDSIITADFSDITCPVGSILSASAELVAPDKSLIPLDDMFRMPLRSRSGSERFVLVRFEQGRATFNAAMNESGLWSINQESINSGLPAEKHMAMKEVQIYVCI